MTYKLTNITLENYMPVGEWEIRFHFGETRKDLWFYDGMTIKSIVQQMLAMIGDLIQNYSTME